MAKLDDELDRKKSKARDSEYISRSGSGREKNSFLENDWGSSGKPVQDAIHNANGYKQAIFSVTSFGKSRGQSSSFVDYMSQSESLDLLNEKGEIKKLNTAKKTIGKWIKSTKKRKGANRYTMHLMLSGDKALDRKKMEKVTKDFIQKSFAGHEAIFAVHTDKDLIHSHVSIKMVGPDGKKIAANKSDLKKWRSEYAEVLREHGIKASATSRVSRGLFGKSPPPGLKIVKELYGQKLSDPYPRRYDKQQIKKWNDVYSKIGENLINSANDNLIKQGKQILNFKARVSAKVMKHENEPTAN